MYVDWQTEDHRTICVYDIDNTFDFEVWVCGSVQFRIFSVLREEAGVYGNRAEK